MSSIRKEENVDFTTSKLQELSKATAFTPMDPPKFHWGRLFIFVSFAVYLLLDLILH